MTLGENAADWWKSTSGPADASPEVERDGITDESAAENTDQ